MTDDRLLSSPEVCAATGATYRQLDYWVRAGIIYPKIHSHGSGSRRWWHPDQLPKIRALAALSLLVATPGRASKVMRAVGHSANPDGPWQITVPGLTITITPKVNARKVNAA